MAGLTLEILFVALLILLNGFFAAAEIAVVAARKARLQGMAEEGNSRAQAALRLKADPDRFLATVQIGVTLVGTLASAVGGAAVAQRLEPLVAGLAPWARQLAEPIAVGIVVFAIAYLSLVVGELVPKSLAVRHAESLALWVAPKIQAVSRISGPAVSVLTASSRLVLRVLGQRVSDYRPFHTLEDLRAIAAEAEQQGVVKGELVSGAVEFHEREVREVLTPRTRVKAIPADVGLQDALRIVIESGHSRFPVYAASLDNIVGFIYARDVYEAALAGKNLEIGSLAHPPLLVPERKPATALLNVMRNAGVPMAMAIDEHGAFAGIVTMEDLVEVIVGEIRDEHKAPEPHVRAHGDGTFDADGSTPVHELNGDHGLKLPESGSYVSIAGLVLERLGRMPQQEDAVDVPPYRLVVTATDGKRIFRVRIEPAATPEPAHASVVSG